MIRTWQTDRMEKVEVSNPLNVYIGNRQYACGINNYFSRKIRGQHVAAVSVLQYMWYLSLSLSMYILHTRAQYIVWVQTVCVLIRLFWQGLSSYLRYEHKRYDRIIIIRYIIYTIPTLRGIRIYICISRVHQTKFRNNSRETSLKGHSSNPSFCSV